MAVARGDLAIEQSSPKFGTRDTELGSSRLRLRIRFRDAWQHVQGTSVDAP